MTLLRLSISRNFSDSFFFLPFFLPFFPFLFFLLPYTFLASVPRGDETKRGQRGRGSAPISVPVPFPWYCDCAISDELVKLAQSAVRLHVAHPSFLHPLRLHPYNPLVFSVGWPVNRKRYKPRPRF